MTHKHPLSRRRALGAVAIGAGAPALVACAGDSEKEPSGDAGDGGGGAESTGSTTSAGESGKELTATSEVPVGSGIILASEKIVVTQPTEGEFKAFSSACTHAGCPVTKIADEIECDCHGSKFAIADGSVVQGPATSALTAVEVTVEGDQIVLS